MAPRPPHGNGKVRAATVALALLVLATLAAFSGALRCGFVHDDRAYLLENPGIALGLSPRGIAWAFTSFHAANWHPLTWISHLIDAAAFGSVALGHHATSVALHALNALLLALVLRRATGALWLPAWVAAAFALHPLRVESVVWVSERKDVLSLLFALLTLAAYVGWCRRGGAGRYALALVAYAAGLMAKPTLVPLPLGLLLVDFWPLGRLRPRPGDPPLRPLLAAAAEKIPFALLSVASAALTLAAQSRGGAVLADARPLAERAANAAVSVVRYLSLTAWPEGLAVFYPLPSPSHPGWKVFGSLALIAALTAAALAARRRAPAAACGWFWFLVSLAPVLGFVQVGLQALADRYTYLPHIGLLVAAAWIAAGVTRGSPRARRALGALATAALVPLGALTVRQTGFWRDELTLYARAANVNPSSWFTRFNLGTALEARGRLEEAGVEYETVLRLHPGHVDARLNLGHVHQMRGRGREAAALYREVIRIAPGESDAWNNLGVVLAGEGRREEALRHVREAVRLDPGNAAARENLRVLLGSRP